MRTRWTDAARARPRQVTSPVSLVVTAFASLPDVRGTLDAAAASPGSALVLVDLGAGRDRLGGSVLAQASGRFGGEVPDLDDPRGSLASWRRVTELRSAGSCSPTTTGRTVGCGRPSCEMAFAGAAAASSSTCRRVAGALRRGARCGARGAGRPAPTVLGVLGDRTAWATWPASSAARRPSGGCASRWRARPCSTSRCATSRRRGTRCPGGSRRCATTPRAPTRSMRPSAPTTTRVSSWRPTFDPTDDIAAPYLNARRPAQGRDPARAGRQQPRRDGVRLRPGRVSTPTTCT